MPSASHRGRAVHVQELIISAPRRLQDPQAQRLTGFLRALGEYGLTLPDAWFFRTSTYEQGGAEMAQQFLQLRDRPTAIAIVNDYVAMAFMVEVMRTGLRVPQDLSIIGHDNQPIAVYCPVPLTTMTQPVEQIVRKVADLALDHLDTDPPDAPRTLLLRGDLVQRASVIGI